MLDQYRRIKREHQEDILFFRLGDFYEMFSEDALLVSGLLNLTLTSRNGLPMCGVPHHSVRSYIARLLKLGKKIAICEQLSEPGKGRGVMERKVVEVITPGTTIDEDFLDKGSSNYLAALAGNLSGAPGFPAGFISFAYIELSTGEFFATAFPAGEAAEGLRLELERLGISEMVAQESLLEENGDLERALREHGGIMVNRWADWLFDAARSRERLEAQFGAEKLAGFGLRDHSPEILAAGALLDYVADTAGGLLSHVRRLSLYGDTEYVGIDEATQRNLELVKNQRDGDIHYSLCEVLDETRTGMGRRLLKRRILHPLRDRERINARLNMVEALYRGQAHLAVFRELLGKCPDLERLCSRLAMDKAHGRDMLSVRNALSVLEAVGEEARRAGLAPGAAGGEAPEDRMAGDRLAELRRLLERGLAETPPVLLTEGNLIRDGYSPELDELRGLKSNSSKLLEAYLEEERLRTGIASLKIKYNRVIGYFLEVTKAQLGRVPADFVRRQGISGMERYSTEKLGLLENDINSASGKIVELEKQLFLELREKAKALVPELSAAASRLARLDAAQSLARAATVRGWVRPVLHEGNSLRIIEGRHPVVEAHLHGGEFIPNDTVLDQDGVVFALITGPNMAGKSTYLRQAALITIMAQMGSFVPAREAEIGITDRIYCRVGAQDNLARGESTFLTEMNETAYILNTATERSLVIMDEVGRGTGTEDGLSIAWAVCEELLERVKCRTLFATHYHELSRLDHPGLANRSMEVLDRNGEVVFLRRLREGPAADSYGIHVAALAGLPPHVVRRASALMEQLKRPGRDLREAPPSPAAEPLDEWCRSIGEEAARLDIDRMTPLDALNLLQEWKRRLPPGASGEPRKPRRTAPRPDPAPPPTLFD
ncbi:MAG: DNA mismatch repair protein MutS [Spirochaetaceae bacterium]|jgi:DNA mismatch repair protein MutS|nr:DNA mismatch repair protein MutS [Spirochaetaceae bacterium]